jgi:hypothetical protein
MPSLLLMMTLLAGLARSMLVDDLECSQCDCDDLQGCKVIFRARKGVNFCCLAIADKHLHKVHVEVNCSTANSWILSPQSSSSDGRLSNGRNASLGVPYCGGYNIHHVKSCLTQSPSNLCEYPDIRKLSLSRNKIAQFPTLSCLSRLNVLDLDYNFLTEVPRDAFTGFEENIAEVSFSFLFFFFPLREKKNKPEQHENKTQRALLLFVPKAEISRIDSRSLK